MALVEDRQDPSLEQLEAAFVAALDALDKVLVLRAQLDATFRDGCFNLSRARYNLGALRVGQLQYPASMTASVRVTVQPGSLDEGEIPSISIKECSPEPPWPREPQEQARDAAASDAPRRKAEGLRRRGQAAPEASPDLRRDALIEEAVQGRSKPQRQDPLKWFGALVPPALRDAQGNFSSALSTAVELADAITRMECSRRAFFQLAGLEESTLSSLPKLVDEQDDESESFDKRDHSEGLRSLMPLTSTSKVDRSQKGSTLIEDLALKYGAT